MTSASIDAAFGEATVFADGESKRPSGEPFDVVNPAAEEQLATIASATAEEVRATLAAPRRAQSACARLPAAERGRYLRAIADVDAHRDELAARLVQEVEDLLAHHGHARIDVREHGRLQPEPAFEAGARGTRFPQHETGAGVDRMHARARSPRQDGSTES